MRFFVKVASVWDLHSALQIAKPYNVETRTSPIIGQVEIICTEDTDAYNVCQMDMSEAYPVVPIPNSEFITFDGRL